MKWNVEFLSNKYDHYMDATCSAVAICEEIAKNIRDSYFDVDQHEEVTSQDIHHIEEVLLLLSILKAKSKKGSLPDDTFTAITDYLTSRDKLREFHTYEEDHND
ncbi:hypothetical protein FACS189431_2060 [Alphaproteobacteria bacterium]|nr:hypothetical protein FACS189431_2060 [Alphaproteobacteria bacterium]